MLGIAARRIILKTITLKTITSTGFAHRAERKKLKLKEIYKVMLGKALPFEEEN